MLTPAATYMKLLLIGNDRELADRLANALQKAGQDVTVDWVERAADAMRRIDDRPDVGAIIVEEGLIRPAAALESGRIPVGTLREFGNRMLNAAGFCGSPDGSQSFSPEFETCRRLADEKNLPLKDIYEAAMRAFNTTASG